MRTLMLHAENFSYHPTKKAVQQAEEDASGFSAENALVVLVTVEEGDDGEVVEMAVEDILEHAGRVKSDVVVVYPYAHLSSRLAPLSEARELVALLAKRLEERGARVHRAPFGWYKSFELKVYGHPLAELSRSFEKSGRIPPLMEASRDFAPKIYEDYLKRFGFSLSEKESSYSPEWMSAVQDLESDFKLCGGEISTVYVRGMVASPSGECVAYAMEGLAQPIRAHFLERALPTEIGRIERVAGEGSIARSGEYLWIQGGRFKFLVGIAIGSERALVMLNTLLAGLIALNVEKLAEEQRVPTLPLKYSVVQAYVAVNPPVSESFVQAVVDMIRGRLKRVVVDGSSAKLSEKLRKAGMLWSPFVVVIGRREEEAGAVSVRLRADGTVRLVPVSELDSFFADHT